MLAEVLDEHLADLLDPVDILGAAFYHLQQVQKDSDAAGVDLEFAEVSPISEQPLTVEYFWPLHGEGSPFHPLHRDRLPLSLRGESFNAVIEVLEEHLEAFQCSPVSLLACVVVSPPEDLSKHLLNALKALYPLYPLFEK